MTVSPVLTGPNTCRASWLSLSSGFAVVFTRDGAETREVDADAESAYARAVLTVLEAT